MNLKDQIKDDLDLIFDAEELAVSAQWKPSGKDSVTVVGFFEHGIKLSSGANTGERKADGYEFSFTCKYDEVKEMLRGDSLTVDGKGFTVALDPVDTYGVTTIILNEAY